MTRAIIIFLAGAVLLTFAMARAQETPTNPQGAVTVPGDAAIDAKEFTDWQGDALQCTVTLQECSLALLKAKQRIVMLESEMDKLYGLIGKKGLDQAKRDLRSYTKAKKEGA